MDTAKQLCLGYREYTAGVVFLADKYGKQWEIAALWVPGECGIIYRTIGGLGEVFGVKPPPLLSWSFSLLPVALHVGHVKLDRKEHPQARHGMDLIRNHLALADRFVHLAVLITLYKSEERLKMGMAIGLASVSILRPKLPKSQQKWINFVKRVLFFSSMILHFHEGKLFSGLLSAGYQIYDFYPCLRTWFLDSKPVKKPKKAEKSDAPDLTLLKACDVQSYKNGIYDIKLGEQVYDLSITRDTFKVNEQCSKKLFEELESNLNTKIQNWSKKPLSSWQLAILSLYIDPDRAKEAAMWEETLTHLIRRNKAKANNLPRTFQMLSRGNEIMRPICQTLNQAPPIDQFLEQFFQTYYTVQNVIDLIRKDQDTNKKTLISGIKMGLFKLEKGVR